MLSATTPPPALLHQRRRAELNSVTTAAFNETTLPAVDVMSQLVDLRPVLQQTEQFVMQWTNSQIHLLAHEKQQHLQKINALEEQTRWLQEQCQEADRQHQRMLKEVADEERQEKELESAVNDLTQREEALLQQCQQLEQRIELERQQVQTLLQQREQQEQRHYAESERLFPEIKALEQFMGLRMETVRADVLKFMMTQIDPRDWTRVCHFVIDVSSKIYSVPECVPMIPDLQVLLDQLNQNRDFYGFVKKVRRRFVRLCAA